VRLLRAAAQSERAPASLRAELDAARGRAARRRRWPVTAATLRFSSVATAVAAAAIALVLTLGSGAASPTIAQASTLAGRGPAAAAPGPDPAARGRLLSARVGELYFPSWQQATGWRSVGERRDRIGNRDVTTVYYSRSGTLIAYSIVSAPRLSGFHAHGEPYMTFWRHGRTVVVWEERNHTCLLSGVGTSARQLWRLAVTTLS
jgi:hypothetical protein